MPEVTVDGEEVVFEGHPPNDVGQLFELLMGAMSERGRAVVSFLVDGVDLLTQTDGDAAPSKFDRIDASTLSHAELTHMLIERVEEETQSLDEELLAYSRRVLLLGWSEIFSRMEEFVDKIKPVADLVDNLGPFAQTYDPPWRAEFETLRQKQAEALEYVLSCFQLGDSAGLSDAVSGPFASMFSDFRKLSSKKMKPYLQAEMKKAG
ncbi:MAG: hypothetical protein VB980_01330 [Opitutales bacterium]